MSIRESTENEENCEGDGWMFEEVEDVKNVHKMLSMSWRVNGLWIGIFVIKFCVKIYEKIFFEGKNCGK